MKEILTPVKENVASITFEVEDLTPPETLLEEKAVGDILTQFSERVEAHSVHGEKLVNFGYHSFIYGMYRAYAEHRPFVLSPDMLWLLVVQGFSCHIRAKENEKDSVFPNLRKAQLIVQDNRIRLGDPNTPWDELPRQFGESISDYMQTSLVETLRCNFSTSGVNEIVASEITIMEAMRPFFEYVVMVAICGIPKITVEGSFADWELFSNKLDDLRRYDLDWWVDALQPIIVNIKKATTGIIDNQFWMNMFKVHTKESYGSPKNMDGWIGEFFPYDKNDKRITLSEISSYDLKAVFESLPKQIVAVDMKIRYMDGGITVGEEKIELWAGFLGLKQNHEDYTLRPTIGWFVTPERENVEGPFAGENAFVSADRSYRNLLDFPRELLDISDVHTVRLSFVEAIQLPKEADDMDVKYLNINGVLPYDKVEEMEKRQYEWIKKQKVLNVNGRSVETFNPQLFSEYLGNEYWDKWIGEYPPPSYTSNEQTRFHDTQNELKELFRSVLIEMGQNNELLSFGVYLNSDITKSRFVYNSVNNYSRNLQQIKNIQYKNERLLFSLDYWCEDDRLTTYNEVLIKLLNQLCLLHEEEYQTKEEKYRPIKPAGVYECYEEVGELMRWMYRAKQFQSVSDEFFCDIFVEESIKPSIRILQEPIFIIPTSLRMEMYNHYKYWLRGNVS